MNKDILTEYFINWSKEVLKNENLEIKKEPHGDEGVVYRLTNNEQTFFLKIKFDSVSIKEKDMLELLENKLPVPKVLGFTTKENSKALLLSALPGKNLASLCKEWSPEKVISKLVEVLRIIHKTNLDDLPLSKQEGSNVLVHGDACLPNFIFHGDLFSGFIDMGDARVGDVEIDLAAAIWSLQYNLGSGYGSLFLKEYGYPKTGEEIVESLRLNYVEYQKEQGFSL